jgi:hypothetical protein
MVVEEKCNVYVICFEVVEVSKSITEKCYQREKKFDLRKK